MVAIMDLPEEILIHIASHLSVEGVLQLRQTNKHHNRVSKERAIWRAIYWAQSLHEPVPHCPTVVCSADNSELDIESLASSVHHASVNWLRPKAEPRTLEPPHTPILPESAFDGPSMRRTVQAMYMILDRWLVVVYYEHSVDIWDLTPSKFPGSSSNAKIPYNGWGTTGVSPVYRGRGMTDIHCDDSHACFDQEDNSILIVVHDFTTIMLLRARGLETVDSELRVEVIATMRPSSMTGMRTILAIEPTSKIIVFHFQLTMTFLHWPSQAFLRLILDDHYANVFHYTIGGVRFLTPGHLLCVHTQFTELLTLDFLPMLTSQSSVADTQTDVENNTSMRDLGRWAKNTKQHVFTQGSINLRGAVLSQPTITQSSELTSIKMNVLAYDILRGVYHYTVEARFALLENGEPARFTTGTPPPLPLDLDVQFFASCPMAEYIPAFPQALPDGIRVHVSRGGFTPGSRGFVSICALGEQAKRGVWAERKRSSKGRSISVFSTGEYTPREADTRTLSGGASSALYEMFGRCIYERHGFFDSGDEIVYCVISEATGTIVYANRRGEMFAL